MRLPGNLSSKCRYALRAIFELALRDTAEVVKVHDIAEAQGIPPRFLEVILAELKHGGFVESRRGKEGGYLLARDPRFLAVGEVIAFVQGVRRTTERRPDRIGDYAFSKLWENVSDSVAEIYNTATFAGLVDEEMSRRRRYVPNYAI